MNAPEILTPGAAIGAACDGGFYAGRIRIAGAPHILVVAPKVGGEHKPSIWIPGSKEAPAARSACDGLANTRAMAEAGSKLAEWALGLRIGGFDDWYLPSLDELEVVYRNLKPTTDENYCWARSGINLNAETPSEPYTLAFPLQTQAEIFQAGAAEAFDPDWYWSSTQHVSASGYAWFQDFGSGDQDYNDAYGELRARAVRRLPI